MRTLIIKLLLLIIVFFSSQAIAADYYIAQTATGSGDGSSCANADALANLTWGPGNKINAGDTLHICGTLTSTLTIGDSGESGSEYTIYFEDNAKFSKAYWGTDANAAIYATGKDYIIIDGGTNGVIENTANGTSLSNQQNTHGIRVISGSHWEIKNLTIKNLYVHEVDGTSLLGADSASAIKFDGSYFSIHDCSIYHVGWGINYQYGADTNIDIYNNEIYYIDHGVGINGTSSSTASDIKIYNNHFHDYDNWDTVGNNYHHDGIHAYNTSTGKATDLWIYNNLFDGDAGTNVTGHIFLESGSSAWTDATGTYKIFGNVLYTSRLANYVMITATNGTNSYVINNTIIGGGTATNGTGIRLATTTNVVVANNSISNIYTYMSVKGDVTFAAGDFDYNMYAEGGVDNTFIWDDATYTSDIATWKSVCNCDSNSTEESDMRVASNGYPDPDSPVIDSGKDLSGESIMELGIDRNGTSRPQGSNWDIGAYEYKWGNIFGLSFSGGISSQ